MRETRQFSFVDLRIPSLIPPDDPLRALLLIHLGFASSNKYLARKLRFDGRPAFLCCFSYAGTLN